MTNQQIAEIFQEMGDLLEMKGEIVFKVRAFQKAARVIGGLTRPLADYMAADELEEIEGIGKGLADKIRELITTGKCREYERLRAEFPPQILTLMDIPGLGPKKSMVLYQELKIGSADELEAAVQSGAVAQLAGFGEKTAQNILKGIARRKAAGGRMPIGIAWTLAQSIIQGLQEVKGITAISEAGSLRRRRETIGDIDILVAARRSEPVMERFAALPQAAEVLLRGDTKCSILTPKHYQVDLRVVDPDAYGAALQYFTGSKEHNVVVRQLAESKGLKINEYGVFKVKTGAKVAGKTEAEVYAAVGLPLIPPEMRETGEEVALALAGELPVPVDLSDIKGDLHSHTHWSDGANTIEEMAAAARSRGYEYLVISDHSRSLKVAHGLSIDRIREQWAAIDALNITWKNFRLLKGTECDILPDGSMDFPDAVLKDADVVVASVHSSFGQDRATMTKRILAAIANPHVDVIGHPSGRLLGQRDGYEVDWEAVLAAAVKSRTAMEVNAAPDRLDITDALVRRMKELGGLISIDSDAHNVNHLSWMTFGVSVARRGWMPAKFVVNAKPLKSFLAWAHRDR